MKYKIVILVLVIFISASLVSCISLEGRLDKLENKYSRDFRIFIESLGNEDYLEELVKDEGRIEEEYKRFIKFVESLSEAEIKYEKSFMDIFRNIEDRQRIMEIIKNDNTMEYLYSVYSWKSIWIQPLILSDYSNDQIDLIVSTVQKMKSNDPLRENFLSFIIDKDLNQEHPFLSLEDWSELYLLFHNDSYELEEIDKFISKLKNIDIEENEIEDIYEVVNLNIKLEEIEGEYYEEFINNLLSIEDQDYVYAILSDKKALDACQNFYKWGRLNDIILKKYSIDFLILLNNTVRELREENRNTYIDLVIDERNDKALNITLLTSDSLPDSSAAMMNIPFYIHRIETTTLSNCDIDNEMNYQDPRFVNGERPVAKGSDFHKLFLECYNSIEKDEYSKKEFLDFLSEQLQRNDIGTYYINIIGHSSTTIEVKPIGGPFEKIYPKELMKIINENAKGKIINLNLAGCSTNKILDIITRNNLMSDNVEYRTILGTSYVPIAWYVPQHPYILASIDRELGFLDRSEILTFNELVSFGNGEDATVYHHGTCSSAQRGTWNCSTAFYDWLNPPEYSYHEDLLGVTVNTQYIICIDYTEYDPERITNISLTDDFAPLIVLTPGEKGFFENN